MKKLNFANFNDVYNAPIIHWDTETYTPISNKFIIDLIRDKVDDLNLNITNDHFKVTINEGNLIKGVIGGFDIVTDNGEFGQRVMFRNSYDKSMSFAFCCGTVVWICSNGCVSGDYTYKRIHRGVNGDNTSTTQEDIVANITAGFNALQEAFIHNTNQLNSLKQLEISPNETYNLLGQLFLTDDVLSVTQMSIIKKELSDSKNFRHLGDTHFTAYDLYNHITEALKTSHPTTYLNDHIATHKLFESTFDV